MSIKIALLGFGTVASGVPFLLKENGEKIVPKIKITIRERYEVCAENGKTFISSYCIGFR